MTARTLHPALRELALTLRILSRNPSAVMGGAIIAAMVFLALFAPLPALAEEDDDAPPPACLLAGPNKEDLPEVILSVGEPLGSPWHLTSGKYYEVAITADGSGEIGLSGGDFFHAIWVDEVVIRGIHSLTPGQPVGRSVAP